MISWTFLSTFPGTRHVLLLYLIILFWPIRAVISRLSREQLEILCLNVAVLGIVTDCGANMRKAFNNILWWNGLRCGCHLIRNVITANITELKNKVYNPTQSEARKFQQVLDKSHVWIIVPHCIESFSIRKNDMKCAVTYVQWLFYRVILFVPHVKRSFKASKEPRTLQK